MRGEVKGLEGDVVVVGSGPGGATVARELSRRGKKVIVCEAGKYITSLGKFYSAGLMMKKGGLTFSREGLMLNIGNTAGKGRRLSCSGPASRMRAMVFLWTRY